MRRPLSILLVAGAVVFAQASACGGSGSGGGLSSGGLGGGTGATGTGATGGGGTGGGDASSGGGTGGTGATGTGATGATGTGATGGGGTGGGGPCTEGQSQPCYTGPIGTDGVGLCKKGTQDCVGGTWGTCNGEVLPAESESCNAKDDDCDGVADEDLGSTTCGKGICSVSVEACKNGQPVPCVPGTPKPAELCDLNGLDDNCDGQVDETCSCPTGTTQPCYTGPTGTSGVGICKAGTQTCNAGSWSTCVGMVGPKTELCNGLDDDCDGTADDGNPEAGDTCDTGKLGECKIGVISCVSSAKVCTQVNGIVPEVCDGKDNDCDGTSDEGNPDGGKACVTGKYGVCAAGTTACALGAVTCNQNVQPSAETCDGKDNDCDNQTDEGNPGGGAPCSTGLFGVCAAGTTSCTAGAIKCNQTTQPSTEACDGVDNDCDNQTDEGCQCVGGQTQSCYTGPAGTSGVGLCKAGISTCSAGVWGPCTGQVIPAAETCNAKDDDCDGTVDDGNPGGGASCSTGLYGVCAAGTMTCTAGAVSCKQNQQAGPELCGNSLDDDCDGVINDGCSIVTAQIIHYELEQTSGTAVPNLAPGMPAGTIVGTYSWLTPGGAPTSSARHLMMPTPGTNAVNPGLTSTALTNATIEFWWKWDSGTALQYMWYHHGNSFRAFTNGVAYAGIYVRNTPGGTDIVYAPSVQTGQWIHLAYVMNATTSQGTFYVNGTSVGTSAYSGAITLDSTFYVLGRNGDNGAQVGYDRFRVWNQALTAAQITAIKNGTM